MQSGKESVNNGIEILMTDRGKHYEANPVILKLTR